MLYKRTSKRSDILVDLSPLIDVVFLLLIFFMVSTRFRDDAGMDLTLPSSQSRQQSKAEFLTIVMDKNKDIKVGDKMVTMDEVKTAIVESLKDFEEKMVVLKVDQSIEHGTVIKLMDAAKGANAEGITFSTSAPTGSAR